MRHDVTFPLYLGRRNLQPSVPRLIALMETPGDITGPINLGNPVEFEIRSLAETVIKLTKSKLSSKPLPADDPTQRQPDISLARKALRWEPSTQLEAGLLNTITYFDALLKSNSASSPLGQLTLDSTDRNLRGSLLLRTVVLI